MDIKIIDSNKGSKCLALDDFKYRKFRIHNSGIVVWQCFIKNCTSTVITCNEVKNIRKINNTHKHVQLKTIKIQEVRNKCKRKTSNDIHETPRKIIRKDMSSVENNTIIGNNDVSSIRKSMYYERRKRLKLLKCLKFILNFVSNFDILTCQNEI